MRKLLKSTFIMAIVLMTTSCLKGSQDPSITLLGAVDDKAMYFLDFATVSCDSGATDCYNRNADYKGGTAVFAIINTTCNTFNGDNKSEFVAVSEADVFCSASGCEATFETFKDNFDDNNNIESLPEGYYSIVSAMDTDANSSHGDLGEPVGCRDNVFLGVDSLHIPDINWFDQDGGNQAGQTQSQL